MELLTDLGYRVLKARDAQSALAIVESGAEEVFMLRKPYGAESLDSVLRAASARRSPP